MCFFKGAKVELGIHHPFTPSFLHTSTIITIYHYHPISTQPIYLGPHTCTSWFDCMAGLIPLDPWFDYAIYVLQVCMSCLPTYELHISLLVVGWEREGTMLLCLMPKIPHILREERRHTPLMPWQGSMNTTEERLERVIQRNLWVLLENLQKLQNKGWSKNSRHSAWLDCSIFQLLKTRVKATSPMVEGNMGKCESHDSSL
jgi:hypothetical protein